MAILKNTTISDTGFLRHPVGTTAQRPSSPAAGMIRFNVNSNDYEYYTGTEWINTSAPQIVKQGLILNLDASNVNSYPGSGSVWFDISGNGNHFTLFNSPSFTGVALSFNGSNQYARTQNLLNLTSLSSITVEVDVKTRIINGSMTWEHTSDWNTNVGGLGLATNSNGSGVVANLHHTNHNSVAARNYEFTVNTDFAVHTNIYSRVSDPTGRLTYGNGLILPFSSANGYPVGTETPNGSFANAHLFLASRGGTSFAPNDIAGFRIYNRKLTAFEVSQNYAAVRWKYGI
jgi:hypothetical protein